MKSRLSDQMGPRIKPISAHRSSMVTILDIGTQKICCTIAKLVPQKQEFLAPGCSHDIEVLGFSYQQSSGIKAGAVSDLEAAERSIRQVVDAAERMAGVTVESLIVNISAGRLASDTYTASIPIHGQSVSEQDIDRILSAVCNQSMSSERTIIHALPIGYKLDDAQGIMDPRGMVGQELGVDVNIITAETLPLRNLEMCINRCHLYVDAMVASPYSSALATLTEDEKNLGVACVDIGAGTTTVSVFIDGHFVYVDAIAIGSHHITMDIARGLSTSLVHAERIKTLHGSALPSTVDDKEILNVPLVTSDVTDTPLQIPKSAVNRLIRPRVEEILELVRTRLEKSGYLKVTGRRLVLTGGGCQLTGICEVASRILARNVRIGMPRAIAGLSEEARSPGFSTSVGLLIYPQVVESEYVEQASRYYQMTGTDGYVSKLGRWLWDNF